MDIFHRLYKNPYGLAAIRLAVIAAVVCGIIGLSFILVHVTYTVGIIPAVMILGGALIGLVYGILVSEAKDELKHK